MEKSTFKTYLFVFFVLLFTASCKNSPSIKEILANPPEYESKTVNIVGEVTQSNAIAGLGYFEISDGTGEIYVFSNKGVPIEGKSVKVQGKVSQYIKLGFVQVVGITDAEFSE